MNRIRTDILEIAFEEGGPPDGIPVLLLHGWPDAPRGWKKVARHLHAEGWRTIVASREATGLDGVRSVQTAHK